MILTKLKHKLYDILEEPTGLDTRIVNISLTILIALNVLAVVLETVEPIHQQYALWFAYFESFSIAIFTVEYVLRVWICTLDPEHGNDKNRRLKYMLSAGALIDLLVLLSCYLPLVLVDMRMARMLRFFRVFRVLKLGRYSKSVRILSRIFKVKKEALLITFMTALVLLLFSSFAMYYAEHDAQPDLFTSIPASMWYSAITLTTVGYGDAYPVTILGKIIGVTISFIGIGLFALPTGILASGFADALEKENETNYCPHCGKELH